MGIAGFGKQEVKVFLVCTLLIFAAYMFFIPPSQYNAFIWNYLHKTAPVYWIGQMFWIVIGAFLLTIFYVILKKVN